MAKEEMDLRERLLQMGQVGYGLWSNIIEKDDTLSPEEKQARLAELDQAYSGVAHATDDPFLQKLIPYKQQINAILAKHSLAAMLAAPAAAVLGQGKVAPEKAEAAATGSKGLEFEAAAQKLGTDSHTIDILVRQGKLEAGEDKLVTEKSLGQYGNAYFVASRIDYLTEKTGLSEKKVYAKLKKPQFKGIIEVLTKGRNPIKVYARDLEDELVSMLAKAKRKYHPKAKDEKPQRKYKRKAAAVEAPAKGEPEAPQGEEYIPYEAVLKTLKKKIHSSFTPEHVATLVKYKHLEGDAKAVKASSLDDLLLNMEGFKLVDLAGEQVYQKVCSQANLDDAAKKRLSVSLAQGVPSSWLQAYGEGKGVKFYMVKDGDVGGLIAMYMEKYGGKAENPGASASLPGGMLTTAQAYDRIKAQFDNVCNSVPDCKKQMNGKPFTLEILGHLIKEHKALHMVLGDYWEKGQIPKDAVREAVGLFNRSTVNYLAEKYQSLTEKP